MVSIALLLRAARALKNAFTGPDLGASLSMLDGHALRDLGLDRSEIPSLEAEMMRRCERTRRHEAAPLARR
jgi:hypothetical protein